METTEYLPDNLVAPELSALSSQMPADASATDAKVVSAWRAERLAGLVFTAALLMLGVEGILPLTTIPKSNYWVAFVLLDLSAFIALAVALLLVRQSCRHLKDMHLGCRPRRPAVGAAPRRAVWFWTMLLMLMCSFFIYWWIGGGIGHPRALPFSIWMIGFIISGAVGSTRWVRNVGRFRDGWDGYFPALILAAPLATLAAYFTQAAAEVGLTAFIITMTLYLAQLSLLAGFGGWALALSPVPLDAKGHPVAQFPVSVFTPELCTTPLAKLVTKHGLAGAIGLVLLAAVATVPALVVGGYTALWGPAIIFAVNTFAIGLFVVFAARLRFTMAIYANMTNL